MSMSIILICKVVFVGSKLSSSLWRLNTYLVPINICNCYRDICKHHWQSTIRWLHLDHRTSSTLIILQILKK